MALAYLELLHAGYMINRSIAAAATEVPGYQMYHAQDAAYVYDKPCKDNYVPSTTFCTKVGTVEACLTATLAALAVLHICLHTWLQLPDRFLHITPWQAAQPCA